MTDIVIYWSYLHNMSYKGGVSCETKIEKLLGKTQKKQNPFL